MSQISAVISNPVKISPSTRNRTISNTNLFTIILSNDRNHRVQNCVKLHHGTANYGSHIHRHCFTCSEKDALETTISKFVQRSPRKTQINFLKIVETSLIKRLHVEGVLGLRPKACHFCRFFQKLESNGKNIWLHIVESVDSDLKWSFRLSVENNGDSPVNGKSEHFFAEILPHTFEDQSGKVIEDCLCTFDRYILDEFYREDLK